MMQPMSFEFNNPRYRCCCSSCHATTGAKVLGYIQLVGAIISIVNSSIQSYGYGGGQFLTGVAAVIITLIAVVCLLWGLHVEKGGFLIVYMVFSGITLLVYVGIIGVGIAVLATGDVAILYGSSLNNVNVDQHTLHIAVMTAGGTMICVGIISIIFYIWFISIVLAAYRFITEKENFSIHLAANKEATMQSAQLPPPYYSSP